MELYIVEIGTHNGGWIDQYVFDDATMADEMMESLRAQCPDSEEYYITRRGPFALGESIAVSQYVTKK